MTWKVDLKQEIKVALEEVKSEGMISEVCKKNRVNEGQKVPEFALICEKKSFGTDKCRVFTTGMSVEKR